MLNNKRGILTETIIFIILIIAFTALVLAFITRLSYGTTFYEQSYAKLIALTIDSAKPGTNITLYVPEMYALAHRNKISDAEIISINSENKIIVKLYSGKGYSFKCFAPVKPGMIELNSNENIVKIIA